MMAKIKGLGRGLDALLGDAAATSAETLATVAIQTLQPGKYQPRTRMDPAALVELAASIIAQGVIQPILVRALAGDHYEIIAGERRWRAAQHVGLTEVPVIIREVSDQNVLALALIENIQREDLNALEEAHGLQRLIQEFNLTHEQVAQAIGRSRSAVTNLLRLTQLAGQVQDLLLEGALEMGHARALLALSVDQQILLGNKIAQQKLSVREAEKLVQTNLQRQKSPTKEDRQVQRDPNLRQLEENLAEKLGAKVQLQTLRGKPGRGRLIVEYHSLDQLDGILQQFR